MSTTPVGVKQRGSKFNHKLIATELGFRGRRGLLDELCVDGLSVVVVIMFAFGRSDSIRNTQTLVLP